MRNVFAGFTGKLLQTLQNSSFHKTCYLEDYIMLPEVKQLHSSVRNYSTAPIKLTKLTKLEIRSRYEMFVYTRNNRIQYQ